MIYALVAIAILFVSILYGMFLLYKQKEDKENTIIVYQAEVKLLKEDLEKKKKNSSIQNPSQKNSQTNSLTRTLSYPT